MHDVKALQRQQAELEKLKEEIEGSLDDLVFEYRAKTDELLGRRAPFAEGAPDSEPVIIGLEWRVKDEAPAAALNAERLIQLMTGIRHDIAAPVQLNSLSGVPDERWDEYMGLWTKYREAKDQANALLQEVHQFARDHIDKHR